MKKLIILVGSVLCFFDAMASWRSNLKSGDVILISLPCYQCRLIELETESEFSHSGLVLKSGDQVHVIHALQKVRKEFLDVFLKRRRVDSTVAVVRAIEFFTDPPLDERLSSLFLKKFKDLPFDSDYLWDNFDEEGRELIYCSEMITKILNYFLTKKLRPTPMDFSDYFQHWIPFFPLGVPEGELGNNPAKFYRSKKFKLIFQKRF